MKGRSNLVYRLFVVVSISAAVARSACASGAWNIHDPYADVDWSACRQHKANFHTHTTRSDGALSAAEAIDEYHKLGYSVLALTDHNKVTRPWADHGRDAGSLKMVAVQGSEASLHHHIGTCFCDVPGASSATMTLAQVKKQGGVAVMFHPGRYEWSAQDYVALYTEWDELIGMEIFSQGDRYSGDRQTWDKVLTALMPAGRPVWGFSNDDMHLARELGRNWNVLLLPELSPDAVRTAMRKGAFFFVYAPEGHRGAPPPRIKSLEVDSRKGTIRIRATGYGRIEWISNGVAVHQGDTIDLSKQTGVRGYVRAVLYANDGGSLIGTQPLRIQLYRMSK